MSRLRLFSLAALGINTIVGSGIFGLPSELAQAMGSSSPLAFVAAAAILGVVACAYAMCGRHLAGDGGAYLYSREAFGRPIGIAIGISIYAATVTTWASVCAAIPDELAAVVPSAGGHPRVYGTVIVVIIGIVNALGVRGGAWLSDLLVVAKLLPLIVFAVVGLVFVDRGNFTGGVVSTHGLGAALLPAFFALSGFESAAIPAGLAEKPKRDVPLAVIASLGSATLLYVLIQVVVIGVLPGAASSKAPLVDASRVFLGDVGATAMAVLAVVSMLGLASAMAVVGARLGATLTSDRRAVAVTTVLTAAGTLALDFDALVDYTSYLLFLQYGAVVIAAVILAYRRR